MGGSGEFLTVPSGYATIQIPAVLRGSGIACTALYPYYGSSTCGPPPNVTQPTLIANVNIDVDGYLTYTFAPASGSAQNGEVYSAVFTPTPEPAAAFLLLGSLPILVLLRRRAKKWSS